MIYNREKHRFELWVQGGNERVLVMTVSEEVPLAAREAAVRGWYLDQLNAALRAWERAEADYAALP